MQVEGFSLELGWPGERSSLSNWFVRFLFEITPRSVLSSPLTKEVGVNWEPVRELAGELDAGRKGGIDLSTSISS